MDGHGETDANVDSGRDEQRAGLVKEMLADTKSKIEKQDQLVARLKHLKPEKYERSDKGNAELFADVFRSHLGYNVTAREWFRYDGARWVEDTGGMYAAQAGKDLRDALLIYAVEIEDDSVKDSFIKYIAKLGSRRIRCTMIEDARDLMFFAAEDLDKDLYLLNVQNGTLDLRNFQFKPHDPRDLISKICNVSYDPAASSEAWEKFMDEIMEENAEKIRYLQKILGLSLTGGTKEECCWLLYGPTTRNGKSTLVETYAYMLGGADGYALNMKPETLATKQNNDSRTASGDIARLKGCRFLNASEPDKRMRFDTALLKNLLGRDTITARHLHQSEFQFVPTFKLVINTNFLPLISDDTLFTSGRLNVITFDRHFGPEEQDRGLKDRLQKPENLSGLLNWCLDGLRAYYREGLEPPMCVISATAEYQASSDKIGTFIGECLIEDPKKNCSIAEAYKRFEGWCHDNGYGVDNKSNFIAEIKGKGIYKANGTVNGKTFHNVIVGYEVDPFEEIPEGKDIPFD